MQILSKALAFLRTLWPFQRAETTGHPPAPSLDEAQNFGRRIHRKTGSSNSRRNRPRVGAARIVTGFRLKKNCLRPVY